MNIYEITFSPTGGTKKAADIILDSFEGSAAEISLLPGTVDYSTYSFEKEDICLIAIPSFGGRVPAPAVERICSLKGGGAKAVLVCVYGNRAYEDTLLELKNAAKEAGFHPVAAIAAIAEHSIMHQFAARRPDADDIKALQDFSKTIWQHLLSDAALSEVSVPGSVPFKEYGGVPFKPETGDTCSQCGTCANECPVKAIPAEAPATTDETICISCMRCIAVCPQKARSLNEMMLAGVSAKMASLFAAKKENELFL